MAAALPAMRPQGVPEHYIFDHEKELWTNPYQAARQVMQQRMPAGRGITYEDVSMQAMPSNNKPPPQGQVQVQVQGQGPGQHPPNMRPDDWIASNKCKVPKGVYIGASGFRPGDWICPACNNHNWKDKTACNKCHAPKPVEGMMGGLGSVPGMMGWHGNAMGAGMPKMGGGGLPPNMRPGDWICPQCNNHNYASKTACNRCMAPRPAQGGGAALFGAAGAGWNQPGAMGQTGAPGIAPGMAPGMQGMPGMGWPGNALQPTMLGWPGGNMHGMMGWPAAGMGPGPGMGPAGMLGGAHSNMRPGDWICRACNNHNYADKTACNKCKVPKDVYIASTGMREGDWICPQCNNHNYADKTACNKCHVPKAQMNITHYGRPGMNSKRMREGDWMCPACNNHNFADKIACNKCSIPKPANIAPVAMQ